MVRGRVTDDTFEARVLQMPVRVWARSQEQHDALMREFALMSVPPEEEAQDRHLPTRLTQLMETLTAQFEGVATEQEQQLFDAAAAGVDVIDEMVYRMPRAVAPASRVLGEMLDEADEYCRQGQHLLTLAADEELVRFRWWLLDQFIEQADGKPPVAWPDYRRR
jgi:membrane carboxypeptidase/penicillin-binding protein PbpC